MTTKELQQISYSQALYIENLFKKENLMKVLLQEHAQIWTCFFVLWIPESGMIFLNYGLLDPK